MKFYIFELKSGDLSVVVNTYYNFRCYIADRNSLHWNLIRERFEYSSALTHEAPFRF